MLDCRSPAANRESRSATAASPFRGEKTSMARRTWIVLGVLGVLVVGGLAFVAIQARPMLSPDLRRARALDTLTSRGVDDVRAVDVPFGDVTLRAYVTAEDDPAKPTVLFVHGSPGDWTDFVDSLADPALRAAARLVSMDRLGYGGSAYGRPEGSMGRHAAAAIAVLDHLGAERAVLVGHSLGGPVVARAAMDFPSRVAAIVPVGGSADPTLEDVKWYQIPASWAVVRPLVPTMLDVCNQEILPHRAELEDMAPRWSSILCPVVIVHGGRDVLVPVANADYMAARVRSDLVIERRDADMNHFVPWSHPGLLRQAILDALDAASGLRAAG